MALTRDENTSLRVSVELLLSISLKTLVLGVELGAEPSMLSIFIVRKIHKTRGVTRK